MTSGLCKSNEHDSCTGRMKQASGKKFACDCGCHGRVVTKRPSRIEEDEDGEY